ncbi:acyl carrier protein [Streptomyces violaceorubidus]|uniref:Acyl carrier protein n=1 Tax=Streptomyces violaceorubidus TaxID=284042 RepID=A0ABV1T546_9ACTN|nr:acyl carrier protein [Streptomyces violaceorubidus]
MNTETPDVHAWLTERVAVYLRRTPAEIDTGVPMAEYGLDSLTALALSADVEDEFGVVLSAETTWDNPTIDALSEVLGTLIEEKA